MKDKRIVKIFVIFLLLLVLFFVGIRYIFSNNNSKNNAENFNMKVELDGKRLYVQTEDGVDILNNFGDRNNPYVITPGEELNLYAKFEDSEYEEMKSIIASTVYENDIQTDGGVINVVTRGRYDTWVDDEKKLIFSFKGSNVGLAKIVLHENGNWGDAIEEFYIRVANADTIYLKINDSDYLQTNQLNLEVDNSFEAMVLFNDNLTMNGNVPSEQQDVGSGFWSWNMDALSFKNEWTNLGNDKWLLKTNCSALIGGQYLIYLAKNGNGQFGTIKLDVTQNKMFINDIKIGNKSYNSVDKNLATQMFNGINSGVNSESNRFVIYVGQTVQISANGTGQTFYTPLNDILTISSFATENDGVVTASFTGVSPGATGILLQKNGATLETFHIEVRNPIYVQTALGEYSKDNVHEYIKESLQYAYKEHPENFIISKDLVPLYVKNYNGYYGSYYLRKGDTVILTTYLNINDNSTFKVQGGIEMVPLDGHKYDVNTNDYVVTEVLDGEMAGFKKLTAEFKAISDEGIARAYVGSENFAIAFKPLSEKVHHFDLETADGGTYSIIDEKTLSDGTKISEEVDYNAYVSGVHGSSIYYDSDNLLKVLDDYEYWIIDDSDLTQFESTSAYLTNNEKKLIDNNGNVIDDDVRQGRKMPIVKERNVEFAKISKVVFDADLHLIPIKKVITTKVPQGNGEYKEDVITENLVGNAPVDLKDIAIEMNYRDIIDAYNKCPDHTGLDLTTKITILEEHKVGHLKITKEVEGNVVENDREFDFSIEFTDEAGKNLNGTYGDIDLVSGFANFKLKANESITILNIPEGLNYVVKEVEVSDYKPNVTNNEGKVKADDTIDVKFINVPSGYLPNTGQYWIPVIIFIITGLGLFVTGAVLKKYEK